VNNITCERRVLFPLFAEDKHNTADDPDKESFEADKALKQHQSNPDANDREASEPNGENLPDSQHLRSRRSRATAVAKASEPNGENLPDSQHLRSRRSRATAVANTQLTAKVLFVLNESFERQTTHHSTTY